MIKPRVLEREEEVTLFALFRAGDSKAGDTIILSNMGFATNQAARYARQYRNSLEDLRQEAAEALLLARDRFEGRDGARFITYAAHAIASRLDLYCKQQRDESGTETGLAEALTDETDPSVAMDSATVAKAARATATTRRERVIVERRLLADEPTSLRRMARQLRTSLTSVFVLEGKIVARLKAKF